MPTSKPAFRAITPVFLVSDIAPTMRWYAEKLGFTADPFPETPPYHFCILRKDGVEIFLQQLAGYRKPALYEKREGGVWNAYIHVEQVSELFASISSLKDVKVVEPIRHQPYGQTEFVIEDPNGYTLVFAKPD